MRRGREIRRKRVDEERIVERREVSAIVRSG